MIRNLILLIISGAFSFIIVSCAASTADRYSEGSGKNEMKGSAEKNKSFYPEDFNLSGYHTRLDLKEDKKEENRENFEIWYNYTKAPDTTATVKTAVKTIPGYRVQVLSTDNLDEANKVRSEIFFKTTQKAVYVIFDPPFYRVEVGDFIDLNDAKNLSFKLKQSGYSDARVVNETINVFD
jgi:cell division protein FtsN